MAYVVKILPRAQRDLEELFEEIRVQHSEASLVWYAGLTKAMFSLDEHPNRCPIVRKRYQLRHLLYGQRPNVYRNLFRVLEEQHSVEVLHIRHGAREEVKPAGLV
jgi:toxin ParE1/3/4